MTPGMWRGLARIGARYPGRRPRRGGPRRRPVLLRRHRSAHVQRRGRARRGTQPAARPSPGFPDSIAGFQAGYTWLRNPAFVSIAAVQGHAIGAGFQLALSCDLRVLADDARLCMKEPALGLVPDLTGTKPLVDIVGLPRAIELCLTARTVGRARGRRARLAELVVPRGRAGRRGQRPGRGPAVHRRGRGASHEGAARRGAGQHPGAAGGGRAGRSGQAAAGPAARSLAVLSRSAWFAVS